MDISFLQHIGLTDKQARVYAALLEHGQGSVRKLAELTELNRGSVYEALKVLQDNGLASYYHKEKKQYFTAENPQKLSALITARKKELTVLDDDLHRMLPELEALYQREGERPVARYYEKKGLRSILEDILKTCAADSEKLYRVYSAAPIREYLYSDFPEFSEERIKRKIEVRVIALGEGGELRGLDNRKWLPSPQQMPTYILIYPGKTAYISLNSSGDPIGVRIENQGVYETQRFVFDSLWERIG